MADSRRQLILAALRTRLEVISTSNGFNTNAGQRVYVGEVPSLGPHDLEQAIVMLPKEDIIGTLQAGKFSITLPVDIVALAKATITDAWVTVEQLLADIKTAVELDDRSLGGLLVGGNNNPEGLLRGTTEPFERPSGSDWVGVSITYAGHYRESWGRPDA